MDISTVIGIIAGFGLILLSIMISGSLNTFINVPAVVIVVGGTLAATLINYPLSDVIGERTGRVNRSVSQITESSNRVHERFQLIARADALIAKSAEPLQPVQSLAQASLLANEPVELVGVGQTQKRPRYLLGKDAISQGAGTDPSERRSARGVLEAQGEPWKAIFQRDDHVPSNDK